MRPRLHAFLYSLAVLLSIAAGATAATLWQRRPQNVIDNYHLWYHRNGNTTYNNTRWMGVLTQKCPLDTWVMQEIVHEVKPDVLVEMGTYKGGSALYFASLFDLEGRGRVVTVDIEDHPGKPVHPRIQYLLGSSTDPAMAGRVTSAVKPGEKVMVLLDSDHSARHVAEELRLYSGLVTPGSYLVVEDTHFNGHPILPRFGPGPWEAADAFLRSDRRFEPDLSREKFGMSFNRRGYLKRLP